MKPKILSIDQDELKRLLDYDPITGVFRWKVSRGASEAGKIAGNVHKTSGYRRISINNKTYRAGRLAFLYMTGGWPINEADHKNRKRDDDRWDNLRDATSAENKANRTFGWSRPDRLATLHPRDEYGHFLPY